VAITSDTIAEGNETVNLALASPTNGATLASPSGAVLTITDNDTPGVIAFSAASYTKNEAGPTATITVSRSGGTASGITIGYATSNGTATTGQDYSARSGTLSFGAGATSVTFTVPITNDSVDEPNETVNLTLSNPGGGATLGARPTAVLTIVDND
jgi:hypothetical protein